jgi:hypothetical protein
MTVGDRLRAAERNAARQEPTRVVGRFDLSAGRADSIGVATRGIAKGLQILEYF